MIYSDAARDGTLFYELALWNGECYGRNFHEHLIQDSGAILCLIATVINEREGMILPWIFVVGSGKDSLARFWSQIAKRKVLEMGQFIVKVGREASTRSYTNSFLAPRSRFLKKRQKSARTMHSGRISIVGLCLITKCKEVTKRCACCRGAMCSSHSIYGWKGNPCRREVICSQCKDKCPSSDKQPDWCFYRHNPKNCRKCGEFARLYRCSECQVDSCANCIHWPAEEEEHPGDNYRCIYCV